MADNENMVADTIAAIQGEAEEASEALRIHLDLHGVERVTLPLEFALAVAARVRLKDWEEEGLDYLVSDEDRPVGERLAKFVQEAVCGRSVEPAQANPDGTFHRYFETVARESGCGRAPGSSSYCAGVGMMCWTPPKEKHLARVFGILRNNMAMELIRKVMKSGSNPGSQLAP